MTFSRATRPILLACAAIVLAPAAYAQPAAPAEETETVTVTEDHLRSFAKAAVELAAIREEVAPKLEDASPEQRQTMMAEVQTRMAAFIAREGLAPALFNAIADAAQQDAEIAQRIEGYAREAAAAR